MMSNSRFVVVKQRLIRPVSPGSETQGGCAGWRSGTLGVSGGDGNEEKEEEEASKAVGAAMSRTEPRITVQAESSTTNDGRCRFTQLLTLRRLID